MSNVAAKREGGSLYWPGIRGASRRAKPFHRKPRDCGKIGAPATTSLFPFQSPVSAYGLTYAAFVVKHKPFLDLFMREPNVVPN